MSVAIVSVSAAEAVINCFPGVAMMNSAAPLALEISADVIGEGGDPAATGERTRRGEGPPVGRAGEVTESTELMA